MGGSSPSPALDGSVDSDARLAPTEAERWILWTWVIGLGVMLFRYRDLTADDAFIFFRYAENIAAGRGYVWNPSDGPIEGVVSGLWLAILSASARVDLPLLAVAKVVGIAGYSGSAILLWRLLLRWLPQDSPRWYALAASLLPLSLPAQFLEAVNGLESSVFLALVLTVLTSAVALLRQGSPSRVRFWALPAACLLACLARPDGVAYSAVAYGWLAWQRRKDRQFIRGLAFPFLTCLLVPGLVYMAWRWSYFGRVFPNPYYVKSTEGIISVSFVRSVLDENRFFLFLLLFLRPSDLRVAAGRAVLGAAGVGFLAYARTNTAGLGGGWSRYMMVPTVLLAGAATLAFLRRAGEGSRPGWSRAFRWWILALALALFESSHGRASREYLRNRAWWLQTMRVLHRDLTRQLEATLRGTDHSVLVVDAGQGYYLRRDVLDLWGLNDRFIADHSWYRSPAHRGPILDYVFDRRRPSVLYAPAWTADGTVGHLFPELLKDPRFFRDYVFLGARRGPPISGFQVVRGGRPVDAYYMVIAIRRDLPDFERLRPMLADLCDSLPPGS